MKPSVDSETPPPADEDAPGTDGTDPVDGGDDSVTEGEPPNQMYQQRTLRNLQKNRRGTCRSRKKSLHHRVS